MTSDDMWCSCDRLCIESICLHACLPTPGLVVALLGADLACACLRPHPTTATSPPPSSSPPLASAASCTACLSTASTRVRATSRAPSSASPPSPRPSSARCSRCCRWAGRGRGWPWHWWQPPSRAIAGCHDLCAAMRGLPCLEVQMRRWAPGRAAWVCGLPAAVPPRQHTPAQPTHHNPPPWALLPPWAARRAERAGRGDERGAHAGAAEQHGGHDGHHHRQAVSSRGQCRRASPHGPALAGLPAC